MRRLLAPFLVLLILGAAGAPFAAHAQVCTSSGASCAASDGSAGTCAPDPETNGFYCLANSQGGTSYTPAAQSAAAQQTPTAAKSDTDSAYSGIMVKIMTLFAWLVGVAAITLDNAVYYTVVTMGTFVNGLSAVGVTWRILRDIGNIFLIFGFLMAGIMTILNIEQFGYSQKMLPKLLIAAVFLNFSLFIAEAIVDTGNLFATQFYTQINGGQMAGAKDLTTTAILNEGISQRIMAQLGLQTIYGAALTNPAVFQAGNTWLIGFMGIILFLITAFVMFSLAFILIARFVILLFLIITAPIGFAGWAMPKLSGLANSWWSELTEQTLTAPVLLLMLYIALTIITDASFMTGFGSGSNQGGWVGFVQNGTNMNNLPGFAGAVLSFLVAMGLLLAVVIISKKLGAFGGALATQTAGKLSFGVAGWAGRNTGGWLANKAAQGLRRTPLSRIPLAGTGLVKGLDKIGSASFDVRGSKAFGAIPFGGVDAGKAQKGGYKADLKARVEARTKYAKDLPGDAELFQFKEKAGIAKAKDAVAAAKETRGKAEQAVTAATTEKETAEQEVARLTEEKRRRDQFGAEDRAADQQLEAANARLTQSTVDLTARESELAQAQKAEKERLAEQIKAEKDLETATSAKTAQSKYAGVLLAGMDEKSDFNRFFNLAANTEAAKKIRKEAGKSDADRTIDALKEAIEKASKTKEEEEKPKEEKPKEEKK